MTGYGFDASVIDDRHNVARDRDEGSGRGSRAMSDAGGRRELRQAIEGALTLLREYAERPYPAALAGPALPSLLDQCRQMVCEQQAQEPPPIRTVHHLACTGGTLVSRCIAAQPNVRLLSEVDPLSELTHKQRFVPADLIGLAKLGSRPPENDVLVEVFQAGLGVLYEDARRRGKHLVLRDHSHSHFTFGPSIPSRPSLREMVAERWPVRSIVTVRHPFDSFLSLQNNGWEHYSPFTLEEYAARYHAFLDHYAGLPVLRYEDFVDEPETQMRRICDVLGLGYDGSFSQVFSAIGMSGDSGRGGDMIGKRSRREYDERLMQEARDSKGFERLLGRMKYETL